MNKCHINVVSNSIVSFHIFYFSKAWVLAWIVGSNPAQCMDIYPRLSTLYSPVEVEALRRADPLSRETYQMWKLFIILK
jgi:hypothetical protein